MTDGKKDTRRRGFVDPETLRIVAVCDAMGELIEYWGFKRVEGRVWTYLVLSRNPRAQVEIAEALGISKSLVSLTVSELAGRNLVGQTGEHRNAPYEATMNIWPVVSEILRSREWMLLENVRLALATARDEISHAPDESQYDLDHVNQLLASIDVVQALLKTVMSLGRSELERDTTPKWRERASSLIGQLRSWRK